MGVTLRAIGRGLALRCPNCARAPLFTGFITPARRCPACGVRHMRERGEWLGSTETTLILSLPFAALAWLVLGAVPGLTRDARFALTFVVFALAFPFVYRHVRGAWLGLMRAWEDGAEGAGEPSGLEWEGLAEDQAERERRQAERAATRRRNE
ncbi:MAG TPA: DUF983 domain-containing protein [Candidatus Thermoplasmatota archaeon]|nr:DUF983 domain-containing protein [Candidatus Thermoplasmatota archaeon]